MEKQRNNLENIVEKQTSNWKDKARFRQKNKSWIKLSQSIALDVLIYIKENGIKQTELANLIGVEPQRINTILKGKENLTLETISRLQEALGLELIPANKSKQTVQLVLSIGKKTTNTFNKIDHSLFKTDKSITKHYYA